MNARRHLVRIFAASVLCTAAVAFAKNTPVRIEQTVESQFPVSLTLTAITSGEAHVMISVDADGKLSDMLVTGFTHAAFADEAISLLKSWRFSPAIVDGQPVGSRLELIIQFSSRGRVITLTPMESAAALTQGIFPVALTRRVCSARELDHPIELLHVENPFHPGNDRHADQPSGATLVDFYVDEKGTARMPVVVETTDRSYAQAAVDALGRWRFSAPTRAGKPVAVRVQQRFVFPHES